jgi:hypothetical protein
MESNTINDPDSKLNDYITESFKGVFRYATIKILGFDLSFSNEWNYEKKFTEIIKNLREIGRNQIGKLT